MLDSAMIQVPLRSRSSEILSAQISILRKRRTTSWPSTKSRHSTTARRSNSAMVSSTWRISASSNLSTFNSTMTKPAQWCRPEPTWSHCTRTSGTCATRDRLNTTWCSRSQTLMNILLRWRRSRRRPRCRTHQLMRLESNHNLHPPFIILQPKSSSITTTNKLVPSDCLPSLHSQQWPWPPLVFTDQPSVNDWFMYKC